MLAQALVVIGAGITLLLGSAHLLFTFYGPKLKPRDPSLQPHMEQAQLALTRETTVWKAWLGFNASHSLGAMLFGIVYAYLAIAHSAFLFQSTFQVVLGGLFLLSFVILGKLYWFSVPFRGLVLALLCYLAGVAVAWA